MLSDLLVCGVREHIFAYLRIYTLEQAEGTCRAIREAVVGSGQWAETACRELSPNITMLAPSRAGAVNRSSIRRMLATFSLPDVALPTEPLRLLSFGEAEGLAEAINRNRRRAQRLSAPGTTAQIIVSLFRFRQRPAQPGREAALISSKVCVDLSRNGRKELWEFKMSFPASGSVLVWARSREARASLAATGPQAPTELYADVFSIGGSGGPSFQFVDAHLTPDATCSKPGFSSVSGAWGPGADVAALIDGRTAVMCLRELASPPNLSRPSPTVHALGLEYARSRR